MFNLIAALPDGSAVTRSENSIAAWTTEAHFLASVVELLQETNILLRLAYFKPDGVRPKVHRIPRPGAPVDVRPSLATSAEMRDFFQG